MKHDHQFQDRSQQSIRNLADLKNERRWLLWKIVSDNDHAQKKLPFYASGEPRGAGIRLDEPEDQANLVTFDEAVAAAKDSQGFSVGLAILPPMVFIDLDDCLDEAGAFAGTSEQEQILNAAQAANAPIAVSHSRRGLHIFGVSRTTVTRKSAGIEIYTGKRYCAWTGNFPHPAECLPDLTELSQQHCQRQQPNDHNSEAVIRQGERNSELFRVASRLRGAGLTGTEIDAALQIRNQRACDPPLDRDEVERIALGVERYPSGDGPSHERRGWQGKWIRDLQANLGSDYLIKNVIPGSSVAALIGPPGQGKSFAAISIAAAVATGEPWFGHRVAHGAVLYVACEGQSGIANRFVALKAMHDDLGAAPIFLLPHPVMLVSEQSEATRLADFANERAAEAGLPLRLIIIDTLAWAIAGHDENSAETMTALMVAAGQIRSITGATVLLVHHVGKDATRGARGHSSLEAALDTSLVVTSVSGEYRIAVKKSRDFAGDFYGRFELQEVPLGIDQDGDPVSSCVIRVLGTAVQPSSPRGSAQQTIARLLRAAHTSGETVVSKGDLIKRAQEAGLAKSSAQSAVKGMIASGFLRDTAEGIRLASDQHAGGA